MLLGNDGPPRTRPGTAGLKKGGMWHMARPLEVRFFGCVTSAAAPEPLLCSARLHGGGKSWGWRRRCPHTNLGG